MEKENIPKLPKRKKGCIHKISLPLYARKEKNWISSKQITGRMIYICVKCGSLLDKGFVERDDPFEDPKWGDL